MTFLWKRLDYGEHEGEYDDAEGRYVLAEDAINREAVNEAKIRTLEVQLKDAKAALHRVQSHLVRKNRAIVEIRNLVNATFENAD
jgi:hypothetical protein